MKIRFILMLGLALIFSECTTNQNHPVPNIPFDFSIDMTLPSYSNLIGVSGYAYVAGGSKGIIVYHRGIDDFVAFDRHSPADPAGTCTTPLTPNADNFLMLDDNCNGAQFSLYDGSPVSGSDFGLRMYQVTWDGGNNLRIFN